MQNQFGTSSALALLFLSTSAHAQQAVELPVESGEEQIADQPGAEAAASSPALVRAEAAIRELRQEVADQRVEIEDLKEQQNADDEPKDEKLKLYGFTDFGLQRYWFQEDSLLNHATDAGSASFVIGNLNLYLDAQPIPKWRSLVEVRFTNAPHGEIRNFGGLGGTFERTTTEQWDPHAGMGNQPMWGGYTVIERAHTDYNASQYFNVRLGNFFTPFGIWNVDHGQPVLISITAPQIIVQKLYPIRQTGLQIYGSAIAGPWELGYVATLTNGRQELSNFDFDDDKALGARLFARNDSAVRTQFGLSFYRGNVEDKIVNVGVGPGGLMLESESSIAYDEHAVGADFSLDIDRTRVRAEAVIHRVVFEPGKRGAPDVVMGGAVPPDYYSTDAYLILAHQLPFWGIEPYVLLEGASGMPSEFPESVLVTSGGVNVHFSPAVQLKLQASYFSFYDLHDDTTTPDAPKPSDSNLLLTTSRLVLSF